MEGSSNYWMVWCTPLIGVLLDVCTGYIAAAKNGEIDSSVMRMGLWVKLGEIATIPLAMFIEMALGIYGEYLDVHIDIPLVVGLCGYVTLYEVVSVLENIGKVNPTVAEKFIQILGIKPEKMNLVMVEPEEEVDVSKDSAVDDTAKEVPEDDS